MYRQLHGIARDPINCDNHRLITRRKTPRNHHVDLVQTNKAWGQSAEGNRGGNSANGNDSRRCGDLATRRRPVRGRGNYGSRTGTINEDSLTRLDGMTRIRQLIVGMENYSVARPAGAVIDDPRLSRSDGN